MKSQTLLCIATLSLLGILTPIQAKDPAPKAEPVNRVDASNRGLNSKDREKTSTKSDAALQTATSLNPSSLQTAPGLEAKSRGLTPESEWQRAFPKKPNGTSR